MSFSTLALPEHLQRAVADMGFTVPTPIQLQAIPPALEGRDLVACAMTGSGKTAAFLLPTLARLGVSPRRPGAGPRVLVLSPTRELAAQIAEQLDGLARHSRLRGAAIFGGVGMGPQERAFRDNVEILVATPGRLLDHLQYSYASLEAVEILILDEADRMLDMGFLPDIRRVLARVPKNRQSLLFSATMPGPIAALAREMLQRPVEIAVEREAKPATRVEQAVYPVREDLKPYLLLELLRRETIKNVLVFTRTKHRANRLAEKLLKNGVACERIHGNRSQAQRTEALARFKDGRIRVLVATDIAARGIDVEALSHVVNFDVPNIPEDYIHRVGRTARAELSGDAWTFVSDGEKNELYAIERAIGKRLPQIKLEGFDYEHKPAEKLEIPLGERIAAIRAKKAEDRARAKAKAERKAAAPAARASQPAARPRPAERSAERSATAGPGSRTAGTRRPAHPAAGPQRVEARHDGVRRDGARQDGVQRDGVQRDGAHRREPNRGEGRRPENQRSENQVRAATRPEPLRQDTNSFDRGSVNPWPNWRPRPAGEAASSGSPAPARTRGRRFGRTRSA